MSTLTMSHTVLGKPPGVVRWGEPPGVRVPFAHGGVSNGGPNPTRGLCRHNPLLGGVVIIQPSPGWGCN